MTKWEYCQIARNTHVLPAEERDGLESLLQMGASATTMETGDIVVSMTTLRFFGKAGSPEIQKNFGDTIARLGLEGWELVSHTEITRPTVMECYDFKRSIQE
jgi:hypothetical protein